MATKLITYGGAGNTYGGAGDVYGVAPPALVGKFDQADAAASLDQAVTAASSLDQARDG